MKNTILILLTVFCTEVFAQVTNEVPVFVKPGTEVYVLGDMTNSGSGSFEVGNEGLLYVDGTLTNNGSMTFENASSLMRGSTGNDGTGTGTYYVKRQGSTSSGVYNYWSSPMQSFSGVPGSQTYLYNPNNGTIDYTDDQPADPGWTAHTGAMTPGAGYAGRGGGLATFTGDVNNGNVNIPLVYYPYVLGNTAPGTPFNLMGNPYPSAISCASLVAGNPDINGAIYFWDDDNSGGTGYSYTDYAVWNGTGSLGTGSGSVGPPNGSISTGQGFKVRAINGSAVLNFTNAMRVANTTQFFRANGDNSRMWFSLEGNNHFNQILIGVLTDATEGEDRLYDAIKFHGNSNISLSAQNEDKEYCILAFPPPHAQKSVPLSVFVSSTGEYTFRANVMENFEYQNVFFVDTRNSLYVELHEGTEIPIELSQGSHENRFYLNYYPDGFVGIEENTEGTIHIYSGQHTLFVTNSGSEIQDAKLELFNLEGQLVFSRTGLGISTKTSIPISSISDGIYLVRLTSENVFKNQKLLIH